MIMYLLVKMLGKRASGCLLPFIPSFILAIHFDNQRSTTTRTTTKDEDDVKPEVAVKQVSSYRVSTILNPPRPRPRPFPGSTSEPPAAGYLSTSFFDPHFDSRFCNS
jgi:hypothetical protein